MSIEQETELKPHFIPMLGQVLALEEQAKGRRLTSSEIKDVRNSAATIMVPKKVWQELTFKQVLKDIQPENVDFEWQTRRIEFLEAAWPLFVLYVPVPAKLRDVISQILDDENLRYELDSRNESLFETAMSISDSEMEEDEIVNLNNHTHQFLIYSEYFSRDQALEVSQKMLRCIHKLIDVGVNAISIENSYCFHSQSVWRSLLELQSVDLTTALMKAFVRLNMKDGNQYFSLGMQFLGLPDYLLDFKTFDAVLLKEPTFVVAELFEIFSHYLAEECPPDRFQSGSTFSISEHSCRFRILLEQNTVLKEGDIRYNPFGMWHFEIA